MTEVIESGEDSRGALDIPGSLLSADRKKITLAGKDWLTEVEAAFYCGVSVTQFKKHAPTYGLAPRNFMGKKLYEKAELFAAISNSPQVGRSPPPGLAVDMGNSPAIREALERLRRHELRKRR